MIILDLSKYRTNSYNKAFELIYEQTNELRGGKKKKTVGKIALFHGLVPGPGIEPGWIAPTVFETVASTDSAIRADRQGVLRLWRGRFCCGKVNVFFIISQPAFVSFKQKSNPSTCRDVPWARESGVGFPAAAEVVVMDLDAEHDGRRYCRDGVGDDQRPVDGVAETSLHNEEDAAQTHEQKCGKGDGVGVAGADGIDGLWHVAQHHTDGCHVAKNLKQCHN